MITFTRTTQQSNPSTGQVTPTTKQFFGNGTFKKLTAQDAQTFRANGWSEEATAILLFTCREYGYIAYGENFVQPGDVTDIQGVRWRAVGVNPIAPDGKVIMASITVVK